jgi:alcohol dehydrogenase
MTVVLGIHSSPILLPLHPMELFDGRRITGCIFGDFKGKSQLPDIVEKCMKGVCNFSIKKTTFSINNIVLAVILLILPINL